MAGLQSNKSALQSPCCFQRATEQIIQVIALVRSNFQAEKFLCNFNTEASMLLLSQFVIVPYRSIFTFKIEDDIPPEKGVLRTKFQYSFWFREEGKPDECLMGILNCLRGWSNNNGIAWKKR